MSSSLSVVTEVNDVPRHGQVLLEVGAEPPDAEDIRQEGVAEDRPPQDARVPVVGDHQT